MSFSVGDHGEMQVLGSDLACWILVKLSLLNFVIVFHLILELAVLYIFLTPMMMMMTMLTMEMDTRTSPVKVQGELKIKWKHWLLHLRHLRVSVWWKIQVARLASIYDCGTDKFQVPYIQNLVSFQLIRAFSNAV